MKLILTLLCVSCLLPMAGAVQSQVVVTIGAKPKVTPPAIPSDFVGLSFGMKALPSNGSGQWLFSPTNKSLVTIFQNVGISHLRFGGTTVESPPETPIPGIPEIDNLFAFAQRAGVKKIIYSFRLLETNAALNISATNAALAKYIWDHYRSQLDSFSLGNEPDLRRVFDQDYMITNFASYLTKWRMFAKAIQQAVPEAKFSGPDGGSGNVPWTVQFADAERDSGRLAVVTEHFYVGGAGRDVAPERGIEQILSPDWITRNETLFKKVAAPVAASGLRLRFTEASDHYSGGVPDASNTFAAALWALDFLHWWAAQGAVGVNFHNTQWVVNAVVRPNSNGKFAINPKGYGIRAFNLSSRGSSEPLTVANPEGVNLTAYAVRGMDEHFVTLINKEHGKAKHDVRVVIKAPGASGRSEVIYLTAPAGDVSAKSDITLGGESIDNDKPWRGRWTPLSSETGGQCVVKVPAGSAAVVRLSL